MGNVFFFNWEIDWIVFLQKFQSGFFTLFSKIFTMLGEEYFLIFILGLCYWCIDKKLGRKVALSMLGSIMFGTLLKGLVLRRRPYMDNKGVKCIRAAHPKEDIMSVTAQGYSMPSLHSTMSVSVYGSIAENIKKNFMYVLAFLLPVFVGLSRMYFGVHYPTDVISGWCLGIISLFLFDWIENKHSYKIAFITILAIGALGFIYCNDDEFFSCYGVVLGIFGGFLYEEKFVNFQYSKKWQSFIIRPFFGVLIFVVLSTVLKLPVKNIKGENYVVFLSFYRLLRYAVCTFLIIGIYPRLFNKLGVLK